MNGYTRHHRTTTIRWNTLCRKPIVTRSPSRIKQQRELRSKQLEIRTFLVYYFRITCEAVVELSPLLLRTFIDLLVQPWMIECDDFGEVNGMNGWMNE
jgi:hypothetical protein